VGAVHEPLTMMPFLVGMALGIFLPTILFIIRFLRLLIFYFIAPTLLDADNLLSTFLGVLGRVYFSTSLAVAFIAICEAFISS